jgi:hypothetical protein
VVSFGTRSSICFSGSPKKETNELSLNAKYADRVFEAGHRLEDQSDSFCASAIRIKGEVGDEI